MSHTNNHPRRTSTRNTPADFHLHPLEQRQLLSAAVTVIHHPQLTTTPPDLLARLNPPDGRDSALSLNDTHLPIGAGAAYSPSTEFAPISTGDLAIDNFTLSNSSDHEVSLTHFSFWFIPDPGTEFTLSGVPVADFRSPIYLAAGQSLTFQITFAPWRAGYCAAPLVISYFDGHYDPNAPVDPQIPPPQTTYAALIVIGSATGNPEFTMSNKGTPISPDEAASAANGTDFGSVSIGASATRHFTLTNTSDHDIVFFVDATGPAFSVHGSHKHLVDGHVLHPGESFSFRVTFAPDALGTADGTFNVTFSAGDPSMAAAYPIGPLPLHIIHFSVTGNGTSEVSTPSVGSTDTGTDSGTPAPTENPATPPIPENTLDLSNIPISTSQPTILSQTDFAQTAPASASVAPTALPELLPAPDTLPSLAPTLKYFWGALVPTASVESTLPADPVADAPALDPPLLAQNQPGNQP